MHRSAIFILLLLVASHAAAGQAKSRIHDRGPVIDMHVHADPISDFGNGELAACTGDQANLIPTVDPKVKFKIQDLMNCPSPIKASSSDRELMVETLAALKQLNVRRAVVMGPLESVSAWSTADNVQVMSGLSFSDRKVTPAEYRRLYRQGKFTIFGELGLQYRGYSPSDPVWEPYFALAEELDIPVGIHMGEGPPGGVHLIGPPAYRVALGSPLLLEDLLIRHPSLRVYVMHFGSPLVDEMIAMMFSHPNLYVDISCNNWAMPRKQFYSQLERMVDAGFEKRIMFGSDQMAWPKTIAKAIESVDRAPFLTRSQKRDIFYNNAARFLRLSKAQIAADHAR